MKLTLEPRKNMTIMRDSPIFFMIPTNRPDNLGDVVITENISNLLRALGFDVVDLGKLPRRDVSRLANLRVRTFLKFTEWARWARGGTVFVVLPPGGEIPENPKAPTSAEPRSVRSVIKQWLRKLSPPKVRFCVGRSFCIDNKEIPIKGLDWIGARDNASVKCASLRSPGRVTYFPDMALFTDTEDKPYSSRNVAIAASFRERPNSRKEHEFALIELAEIYANGTRKLFHQVTEDASYCEALGSVSMWPVERQQLTTMNFLSFYGATKVVISNRLHCLLFAAACGAVPVALVSSADSKICDLFETLGWQELLVSCKRGKSIGEQVRCISENVTHLRAFISNTITSQREIGTIELLRAVHEFSDHNRRRTIDDRAGGQRRRVPKD